MHKLNESKPVNIFSALEAFQKKAKKNKVFNNNNSSDAKEEKICQVVIMFYWKILKSYNHVNQGIHEFGQGLVKSK